ncbi:hypothetical protein [Pedobacter sp. SG908]|uniref:hypothetical protein n=1 Tax=Pedobacter sp. SG908 TaxID=2587135 RepID=UPI001421AF66|nr:hypothetical protein [Pedobacter sp. SG908]NII81088.1 hypothetical protein [Pedobacter sp. SG908]
MNVLISTSIQPYANGSRLNNKIHYFKWLICIISFCLLFSGCASFSDRPIRRHKVKLNEGQVSKLSGTYQLFPDLAYKKNGIAETLRYQPIIERFHHYISKQKIDFKASENLTVDVRVMDNNQISFNFKKDSIIVDSITLSAKLQSRGLLLLGNKYVEFHGVPYILGGSKSEKTRIGLASDGGLILNHAYDSSGALLLFIGVGVSYDSAYHFKRIK